jgi:hypothetical protein
MKGEKFKDTKCVIRNHIEQGQKFKDQKKKEKRFSFVQVIMY